MAAAAVHPAGVLTTTAEGGAAGQPEHIPLILRLRQRSERDGVEVMFEGLRGMLSTFDADIDKIRALSESAELIHNPALTQRLISLLRAFQRIRAAALDIVRKCKPKVKVAVAALETNIREPGSAPYVQPAMRAVLELPIADECDALVVACNNMLEEMEGLEAELRHSKLETEELRNRLSNSVWAIGAGLLGAVALVALGPVVGLAAATAAVAGGSIAAAGAGFLIYKTLRLHLDFKDRLSAIQNLREHVRTIRTRGERVRNAAGEVYQLFAEVTALTQGIRLNTLNVQQMQMLLGRASSC